MNMTKDEVDKMAAQVHALNNCSYEAKQAIIDRLDGMLLEMIESSESIDPMVLHTNTSFEEIKVLTRIINIMEFLGGVKPLRHQLNPSG